MKATVLFFSLFMISQTQPSPIMVMESFVEECTKSPDTTICLITVQGTSHINIYRKHVSELEIATIVAKIKSTDSGGDVELFGPISHDFEWLAFGISHVAINSMGLGIPALICMHHHGYLKAQMNFLGSNGAKELVSAPNPEDYFTEIEQSVSPIPGMPGGLASLCKFKIPKEIKTLDGQTMSLHSNPYNLVLARGIVKSRGSTSAQSLAPIGHNPANRFITRSKYFLTSGFAGQPHVSHYFSCGVEHYCVGAGFDGCGISSFDCKFFAKFIKKDATTINVKLSGITFEKFVGVGFSNTSNMIPAFRQEQWQKLKMVVVCEDGTAEPTMVRVKCNLTSLADSSDCKEDLDPTDGGSSVVSTEATEKKKIVNSLDEDTTIISCAFDITFNGDDILMMRMPTVRLFVGGNSPGKSSWLEALNSTDDVDLILISTDNEALLQDGPIPPKNVWEVLRQSESEVGDPSNNNGRDKTSGTSRRIPLTLIPLLWIHLSFFAGIILF